MIEFRLRMGPDSICQPNQQGFSLLELLASAVILGIAISGIMSMVGTGRDFELRNELRRQAGVLAAATLEDPLLHHSNFAAIASKPDQAIVLSTVTNTVPAILSVQVSDSSMNWNKQSGGLISVPFKSIRVKVVWTGDAAADSIILRRRVAKVRS